MEVRNWVKPYWITGELEKQVRKFMHVKGI